MLTPLSRPSTKPLRIAERRIELSDITRMALAQILAALQGAELQDVVFLNFCEAITLQET